MALWIMVLGMGIRSGYCGDGMSVKIQGLGYTSVGRVQHVTDTLGVNFNGNWMQKASAQVTAHVTIDEHWEGHLGVGNAQTHPMQGKPSVSRQLAMGITSYIAQASFTYTMDNREKPKLQYTMGYFPYNYNEDVKNLGLYLLRGPVYPGCLISGFETKETQPIANLLGGRLHSNFGNYSQDVLITSEVEYRPYLDYSLAYIGRYKFADGAFILGGGVNFYHMIPVNSKITSPTPDVFSEFLDTNFTIIHPNDRHYIYVDTVTGDTSSLSTKGTKLTSFFSLDIKRLLSAEGMMSDEDLKLYGEIAVIGVKNYDGIYENRGERIPVMMGFNIPTFKVLDHLSLEIEWYGAKYRNDMEELMEDGSPIPRSSFNAARYDTAAARDSITISNVKYPNEDPYNIDNMTKDNWKWSLHAARTLGGHLRISGQIANDHFRPVGTGNSKSYFTAFSTMDDWYWMFKVAYFF